VVIVAEKKVTRIDILKVIEEEQGDKVGRGCAQVSLSIGSTSKTGQVEHNTIVIHEAPPRILATVVELCGYRACIYEGGLHITCDD
jgi:hypothetical protein